MLNAFDLDAGNGGSLQGAEQHAAQSIAKRMAVATLKRLYRKPAIELILAAAAFDTGILNIYHHSFSSSSC